MVAAPETYVRVESPVQGRVFLRVESQVPFTYHVRAVTEISKVFRQQFLVERQSSRLGAFQNLIPQGVQLLHKLYLSRRNLIFVTFVIQLNFHFCNNVESEQVEQATIRVNIETYGFCIRVSFFFFSNQIHLMHFYYFAIFSNERRSFFKN